MGIVYNNHISDDIPLGYEASHRLAHKFDISYSDGMDICRCGLCWNMIKYYDNYCSKCGAKFTGTTYLTKEEFDTFRSMNATETQKQ